MARWVMTRQECQGTRSIGWILFSLTFQHFSATDHPPTIHPSTANGRAASTTMTGILAPQPRHPTASALTAAPSSAPPILSPIPRKAPWPTSKASTPKTPSRPPSRTERKFTCSFAGCSKAYFKPSRLSEHMRTHTGERPHVCDECGQTYLRASHLAAHLRTHKSEADKEFACTRQGCGKKFWTATHLQRHEASHDTAEEHKCEQCTEVFPKTHLLREHVANAHMPAGSKPWACPTEDCGRSFSTKQQLRTHEKTHDRKLTVVA